MRLEVTRKSDLAVRALQALALGPRRMKGPELAAAVGTTSGFLSQAVGPLVRAGWVRSDPGPTGGYSLAVDLERVSVLAVIEAIEGPTDTGRCVLADRPCDEAGTCALHGSWVQARSQLLDSLAAVSVAGTSQAIEAPHTALASSAPEITATRFDAPAATVRAERS